MNSEQATTYTIRANDHLRRPLPDVRSATKRSAYDYAAVLVEDGATYVQICRTRNRQHVALTDWGKNAHGNTWLVGEPIPGITASLTEQSSSRLDTTLPL